MSRPAQPWRQPVPVPMLAYGPLSWSLALSKEPGMFRRRHHRRNGQMSPEASLATAEADRRAQERKRTAERPVRARLDRIIEENDLAARLREALPRPGRP